MALTIEDGTGVDGADSYITTTEFTAFAEKRGVTPPTDNSQLEVAIVKAMDYIETFSFKGARVSASQALQWPRNNVYIFGDYVLASTIPQQLKNAVCQAAIEALTNDLQPTDVKKPKVKRRKVDVIETEYENATSSTPTFPKVQAFLKPIVSGSGTGGGLPVKRG